MAYRIAGIDVHKKMVAVAIADVEVVGTWRFERRQIGTSPSQLRALAEWLVECEVDEGVMESTAPSIGGRSMIAGVFRPWTAPLSGSGGLRRSPNSRSLHTAVKVTSQSRSRLTRVVGGGVVRSQSLRRCVAE